MKKRWFCALLCAALLAGTLTGCGGMTAEDLMKDVKAAPAAADADLTGNGAVAVTEFGVELFRRSLAEEGNTLVSPLSVLCALAMTANGANGETLAQMEEVLGMPVAELNAYLHTYMEQLPEAKEYKLHLANSIWFKEDDSFTVEPAFLDTNAGYYDAALYQAPFDDSTLKDINGWVSENTDGMIEDILNEIPDDAVMYLVNALAFEAEWQKVYRESEIRDGEFTTESGEKQKVEMMHSAEKAYLEDELATGFIKYYIGHDYAFVALLPNEGVSVADYAASLDGEALRQMLSGAETCNVIAATPKFSTEYKQELSGTLQNMGMTNAFDSSLADLSGIGFSTDGNLYISQVLHKTYIAVDEKGTKAGAATAVEIAKTEEALGEEAEPKRVILDRPFVYLLIDCEANLPLFMGTVMTVE